MRRQNSLHIQRFIHCTSKSFYWKHSSLKAFLKTLFSIFRKGYIDLFNLFSTDERHLKELKTNNSERLLVNLQIGYFDVYAEKKRKINLFSIFIYKTSNTLFEF